MLRFLQRLFLFERFKIKTTLTKEEIQSRVMAFVTAESQTYRGKITRKGFRVAEREWRRTQNGWGRYQYGPVIKAKIKEKNGYSKISCFLRSRSSYDFLTNPAYLVFMGFAIWGLVSFFSELASGKFALVFLFFTLPFFGSLILFHFDFFKPAKKLKEHLENLLIE